jgi:MinD superfamily P-loop ATPase
VKRDIYNKVIRGMNGMFTMKPEIDKDKCDGCGLCVGVCHENGIMIANKTVVVIDEVECDWCGLCEAVCPNDAIRCPLLIVFA